MDALAAPGRYCVPRRNAYLSVNHPHDSGFEPHSSYKADMEILVQNQGLKTGTNKQQHCVEVALPVRGSFVIYKVDEQSVERGMSS